MSDLNEQEKLFIQSIKNKIKTHSIPTTIKDALSHALNQFILTEYSNGRTEMVDVGIEWYLCSLSPLYFIKNYAYIDLPGTGVIPFNLYYFQEESLKIATNTRKLIFLKTRQAGISTLFSLYCFWKGNFHESESIDVVSIKQKKAQQFVSKMITTYNRLPPFLKTQLKSKNSSGLSWINGSQIVSESASDKAGRGDSLSLLVLDEAAFYLSDRLTRGIVSAAQPTLTRTGGSMIVISTPNGTSGSGSYYYEQVNQMIINGNNNDEKLIEIDWYEVPDIPGIEPYKEFNEKLDNFIKKDYFNNPLIKNQMKKFFDPISKNWRENEWLKKQHDDLADILFKQEILHSFIVSDDQVFSEDILEKIQVQINNYPVLLENELNGVSVKGMLVWNLPVPKHRYILGVDVGKGTGKDFSSIQVMDVENYEQVAEYKGKISTKMFGRLVKKVAKYYNQAYIVIECNGIGEAVFNEVYYHDTEPYENVYKQSKTKNGRTIMTGWDTNVKTRQLMTNQLIDWFVVEELFDSMKIKSPRLYQELTTWVWSNGRPDHAEGCVSGDTVIITEDGPKEIKDITVGEKVLTHTGKYKEVEKTFKFKDDTKKMLSIKAFGKQKLNITNNQEFFIYNNKFEFKNLQNIYNYKNHYSSSLFASNEIKDVKKIDLSIYNKNYEFDDNFIYYSKGKINRFIDVDEDFLFIMGHILAEGNISVNGSLIITCHKDEKPIIEIYKRYFEKYGFVVTERDKNLQFGKFGIDNVILWNFLKQIESKENKKPLNFLRFLPPEKQLIIYYGYIFGDGSFNIPKKRGRRIVSATMSKNIHYFIAEILSRNKIKFNIQYDKPKLRKEKYCNPQYKIVILGFENNVIIEMNKFKNYFIKYKNNYNDFIKTVDKENQKRKLVHYKDDYLISQFSSVEEVEWNDYYYDLTVKDEHSYIANGYCVHNSHDDTLISWGLCIYMRNKATSYGDSIAFIAEDGQVFEFEEKDRDRTENKSGFGFITTEDEKSVEENLLEESGVENLDQYKWLLESIK